MYCTGNTHITCLTGCLSTWPSGAALLYLPRYRWWGNFCCSACRALHLGRPGTSQSSRKHRSYTLDSRWYTLDHSWEPWYHQWEMAGCSSGRQTRGAHPLHSHPPSRGAGTLVQSHFQDGHTSDIAGFLHSCSSPVVQRERDRLKINEELMDSVTLSF